MLLLEFLLFIFWPFDESFKLNFLASYLLELELNFFKIVSLAPRYYNQRLISMKLGLDGIQIFSIKNSGR